MYTAHFVHENKKHYIPRVRCTDGTLRALATDIFRTVNSSNITLYLLSVLKCSKSVLVCA